MNIYDQTEKVHNIGGFPPVKFKRGENVYDLNSGKKGIIINARAITSDVQYRSGMEVVTNGSIDWIKNNNQGVIMKLTSLMRKVLDKDLRIVIEAGIIDNDLTLTEKGKEELMSILFIEKKPELVKLAEEIIEEEKKTK